MNFGELAADVFLPGPAQLRAGLSALLWQMLGPLKSTGRPQGPVPVGRQPADQALAAEANGSEREDAECDDVRAAGSGDGDAYARIVRRHQDAIAAYMWRFTRDPGRCEELVHDVFVEAYFSLPGYRGRAPLRHWLRKIATRVGYRHWREQSRLREQPILPLEAWDQVAAPATAQADSAEAAEIVHSMLAGMLPRDRLVLTLMYLEGGSVAEIAQWTGWSRTMVKVQAHRARTRLRRLLKREKVK
jgi:RNA polymerase sigma-70 factor (ECF subfamily)